ncbi:MAG: 4-hydroxybenzoyl-CoA thioesterase [Rhodocyclales bacterium RIFCSPLOWO2_02_FULL_63_24]|nr:MAG: 4-hydroxybenzoyl-CoA thioesterase [Rhodocyclales bacterium RIFCSPLOWO2_02_FULL_63_24]
MTKHAATPVATGRSHIQHYRIAFSDCDPAQIVFFANYFTWFDTASREFFTACGVPSWRETERERGIIGTPLVDAQAKFLNSATYGEDIEIETFVESWNTRSFVMRHVARRGDTVLVEGREVRIFAIRDPEDAKRIKPIPIPEDIKALCC